MRNTIIVITIALIFSGILFLREQSGVFCTAEIISIWADRINNEMLPYADSTPISNKGAIAFEYILKLNNRWLSRITNLKTYPIIPEWFEQELLFRSFPEIGVSLERFWTVELRGFMSFRKSELVSSASLKYLPIVALWKDGKKDKSVICNWQ